MSLLNFSQEDNGQNHEVPTTEVTDTPVVAEQSTDDVPASTKLKIVAALLIVGFATYVAYWVQSPTDYKADLLGTTSQTLSTSDTSSMTQATDQTAASSMGSESGFTQQVSISNFAYNPSKVTVNNGTTVVWTNNDSVPHTVTGVDFHSLTLNTGDTYSYTFTQDGTYDYHSSLHPSVIGTIVVGNGGQTQSTVDTTTTTDTTVTADSQTQQTMDTSAPLGLYTEPGSTSTPTDSTASAPTDSTHGAAYDQFSSGYAPDSALLSDNSNKATTVYSNSKSKLASGKNIKYAGKMAKTGPDDILYVAAFGVILFLNRKKLLSASR